MNATDNDKVLSALHSLDPSMAEGEWWQIAAALRSEGEHLFEPFDQWSSGGKNYQGTQDCRAVWNAHPPKPGGKTIGTLFGMAMEAGWKFKPGKVPKAKPPAPPPPPAPAPTQAPTPPNPVYELQNIWQRAAPATLEHPYCIAKGVTDPAMVAGLRVLPSTDSLRLKGHSMAGALLVPITSHDGALCTVQCIAQVGTKADGSPVFEKPNLKGYPLENGYHVIGQIQAGQPVHVAEGIGAAWAIYQATGKAAAITFGVGRTEKVARAIQQHHPEARIVLAPDVGQETAVGKVAQELRCAVVPMPGDLGNNGDAWDFLRAHGPEALSALLATATQPSQETAPTDTAQASAIPSENERPAYRVFEDWHTEDGQKFKPGVWLFDMKAVGKGDNATLVPTQQWVCSPLHVEAITADAYDGSYGRMLRFKNTRGNWRTWAMPMHLLAGDGNELRAALLSMGVEIAIKGRDSLAMYLQSQHPQKNLLCVGQTGWADKNCRAFVLPDGAIGPDAAGVVYQSEDREAIQLYRAAGTLEGWQSGVAAMAVGNPMLALALCLAFSGPLLAKVRGENGGLHYFGDSSTGKTSILYAGASTWGEPEAYKRTWRTTDNGLEGAAAMVNDGLLTLDEIKQAAPKVVDETIYMVGNGQGKGRASRSGGGRAVTRWRCSVLSTGEMSIVTKLAEGGLRIHAGQEVRFLDIPCDNRAAGGVWNNLHHHPDAKALADSIATEAKSHYGHAGKAFLARLAAEDGDLRELLATIQARPEFTGGGSQEQRVAGRFALLALAGELATDYGITGWPVEEAIRAAVAGFAAWRSFRDNQDGANAERGQVVRQVLDFIEQHGDSRFSDADMAPDPARPLLIRDRAGYWRNSDKGRVYLFNSSGLKAALKGYDFKRGIRWLQEAGLLPPTGSDGKSSKGLTIQGTRGRWYEVRPDTAIEGAV